MEAGLPWASTSALTLTPGAWVMTAALGYLMVGLVDEDDGRDDALEAGQFVPDPLSPAAAAARRIVVSARIVAF